MIFIEVSRASGNSVKAKEITCCAGESNVFTLFTHASACKQTDFHFSGFTASLGNI